MSIRSVSKFTIFCFCFYSFQIIQASGSTKHKLVYQYKSTNTNPSVEQLLNPLYTKTKSSKTSKKTLVEESVGPLVHSLACCIEENKTNKFSIGNSSLDEFYKSLQELLSSSNTYKGPPQEYKTYKIELNKDVKYFTLIYPTKYSFHIELNQKPRKKYPISIKNDKGEILTDQLTLKNTEFTLDNTLIIFFDQGGKNSYDKLKLTWVDFDNQFCPQEYDPYPGSLVEIKKNLISPSEIEQILLDNKVCNPFPCHKIWGNPYFDLFTQEEKKLPANILEIFWGNLALARQDNRIKLCHLVVRDWILVSGLPLNHFYADYSLELISAYLLGSTELSPFSENRPQWNRYTMQGIKKFFDDELSLKKEKMPQYRELPCPYTVYLENRTALPICIKEGEGEDNSQEVFIFSESCGELFDIEGPINIHQKLKKQIKKIQENKKFQDTRFNLPRNQLLEGRYVTREHILMVYSSIASSGIATYKFLSMYDCVTKKSVHKIKYDPHCCLNLITYPAPVVRELPMPTERHLRLAVHIKKLISESQTPFNEKIKNQIIETIPYWLYSSLALLISHPLAYPCLSVKYHVLDAHKGPAKPVVIFSTPELMPLIELKFQNTYYQIVVGGKKSNFSVPIDEVLTLYYLHQIMGLNHAQNLEPQPLLVNYWVDLDSKKTKTQLVISKKEELMQTNFVYQPLKKYPYSAFPRIHSDNIRKSIKSFVNDSSEKRIFKNAGLIMPYMTEIDLKSNWSCLLD